MDQGGEHYTILISLEVAGAFDNAWLFGILGALQNMDIPSIIFSLIAGYFSNRFASSGQHVKNPITRRCLQGSVLGPLLWAVLFDRILVSLKRKRLCYGLRG